MKILLDRWPTFRVHKNYQIGSAFVLLIQLVLTDNSYRRYLLLQQNPKNILNFSFNIFLFFMINIAFITEKKEKKIEGGEIKG